MTPQPSLTLLFQYGSNMAEDELKSKITRHHARFAPPGVEADLNLRGAARIVGWQFDFGLFSAGRRHRVADIVHVGGDTEVWGALYELPTELVRRSDGERSVLDRIEGHATTDNPENYLPVRVEVEFAGESVEAWSYVGRDDARERCRLDHWDAPPSEAYIRAILDGAASLGLLDAYVDELKAAIAATATGP
jgi:hypothetical protein